MKLHIGGTEKQPGWHLYNIQSLPGVDTIGDVTDLKAFKSNTCSRVYCSHVLEHLSYRNTLQQALSEIHRVLQPKGIFMVSVPDLVALCRLFTSPQIDIGTQWLLMRMIYGGQTDKFDYHRVGLSVDFLTSLALDAGFRNPTRVDPWDIFEDCSGLKVQGVPISLNMEFTK